MLLSLSAGGTWSSPGQFVKVREDSLGDALNEVMVEAKGVYTDQQGNGLPGNVH